MPQHKRRAARVAAPDAPGHSAIAARRLNPAGAALDLRDNGRGIGGEDGGIALASPVADTRISVDGDGFIVDYPGLAERN